MHITFVYAFHVSLRICDGISDRILCCGRRCRRVEDLLAFAGAAGLGVSLWQIHIYVSPLKKFVQVRQVHAAT